VVKSVENSSMTVNRIAPPFPVSDTGQPWPNPIVVNFEVVERVVEVEVAYKGTTTDIADSFLPGYDSSGEPVGDNENLRQELDVIVKGLTNASGVSLEIDVNSASRHEGYASNSRKDGEYGAFHTDFTFSAAGTDGFSGVQDLSTDANGVIQGATLICRDYGAKVTIIVKKDGNEIGRVTLPVDDDDDGIADVWEKAKVTEWNTQYGESQEVSNSFFASTDDKEKKDPDGATTTLSSHANTGDNFTVLEEYRGFLFDSKDGWGVEQEHLRLSPARKEILLEVERMVGFENAATKNEITGAMSILEITYLNTAGIKVFHIVDQTEVAFAQFGDFDQVESFSSTNKGDSSNVLDYSKFMYLGFIAKGVETALGRASDDWNGGFVHVLPLRKYVSRLPSSAGITPSMAFGSTATHEVSHGIGTKDYIFDYASLEITYSSSGDTPLVVSVGTFDNVGRLMKLEKSPGSSEFHEIPLSDPQFDTVQELSNHINTLDGYLSVVTLGGGEYSFSLRSTVTFVDATPTSIRHNFDRHVVEAPGVQSIKVLKFANAGGPSKPYDNEVKLMDVKKKLV